MLIGITGKAYSGKTTAANYLVENYGFTKLSFATALKEMLLKAGMCTYEELNVTKTILSRWLMQKIGTDIFRNQIDKHYWTKRLCWIMDCTFDSKYVIDDVRFRSEADSITVRDGRIIKVVCPNSPLNMGTDLSGHLSEIETDSIETHYSMTVDYGELKILYDYIDDYMKMLRISKININSPLGIYDDGI